MKQFTHFNTYFYLDDGEYQILGPIDNNEMYLCIEMRAWLAENDISHKLLFAHKDNYYFSAAIKFDNDEDAMAFKLRWL